MIDIVVATRNKNKVREIAELLNGMPVNVLSLNDGNWDIPKIAEDGKTFKENAVKKAKIVSEITGKLTLADDSGLEVDALSCQPGVYSSRFAGIDATDRENNLKLLKMMENIPLQRRSAQFRCAVAIAVPKGKIDIFEGVCRGWIDFSEKGGCGFGYDPIFIPIGYDKSFAELSSSIKNKISHRGRAIEKVKLVLERLINTSEMTGAKPRPS